MKGAQTMENIGKIDRVIRGFAGVVLLLLFFQTLDYRGIGLVATLLLITSVLAYCPFYALVKKSSISPMSGSSKDPLLP